MASLIIVPVAGIPPHVGAARATRGGDTSIVMRGSRRPTASASGASTLAIDSHRIGGTSWGVASSSKHVAGRRVAGCQNGHSAEVETSAPVEECWELWQQRELIPNWMPWIESVVVSPKNDLLSKWTLSTEQFGQRWEFSWVAKNLAPIPLQKIHWSAEKGVRNKGAVRFQKLPSGGTKLVMTISYELPDALLPLGGSVTPVVEGIIKQDLERFDTYVNKVIAAKSTA